MDTDNKTDPVEALRCEAWLADLDWLITQATNASFDCGEASVESAEYGNLCNRARAARIAIRDAVRAKIESILANPASEPRASGANAETPVARVGL
jgi:hypothetical protein